LIYSQLHTKQNANNSSNQRITQEYSLLYKVGDQSKQQYKSTHKHGQIGELVGTKDCLRHWKCLVTQVKLLMNGEENKYQYVVEWTDPHASLVRVYTLTYYQSDNSFEMVSIHSYAHSFIRSFVHYQCIHPSMYSFFAYTTIHHIHDRSV